MHKVVLENFERAIIHRSTACWEVCDCGLFWWTTSTDGTWEDGELDRMLAEYPLHNREDATGSYLEVGEFDNREWVMTCDCRGWHKYIDMLWNERYTIIQTLSESLVAIAEQFQFEAAAATRLGRQLEES